jgi:prepilin-type N-terminal cleavage/methylation domain-containing protein
MTRRPASPRRFQRNERGFTLLELLVTVIIMLVVTGAIFALVDPSRGTFRAQPEVADIQQRMRVGVDTLSKDLVMAGAGVYLGSGSGSLINFFAPVFPYCVGALCPEPPALYQGGDQITITYVPNTPSQTSVRDAMPDDSNNVKTFKQTSCGTNGTTFECANGEVSDGSLCGFCVGDRAAIFDDTGSFDFFTVMHIQADNNPNLGPQLNHRGQGLSKQYCHEDDPPMVNCKYPGHNPQIAKVETHTYFLDRDTRQLMHYTGDPEVKPVPVLDNVVDLRFEYFGDPNPLLSVKCEAAHTQLPSSGSSLVLLDEQLLRNGEKCPPADEEGKVNANAFDADLYRVRKIRVLLRVQTGLDDLRGRDAAGAQGPRKLFQIPGYSASGTRFVPDYELSFEVSPRNMNLAR